MSDGTLRIIRPESYVDQKNVFEVFINNRRLGTIGAGENLTLPLNPGTYHLKIRQTWWSGSLRRVTVEAGKETIVGCRHRLRGFFIPMNVFLMLTFPWRYLNLEVIPA